MLTLIDFRINIITEIEPDWSVTSNYNGNLLTKLM